VAPTYDGIIIGTGQAGPALADRMNDEGLKVAVLERQLYGGTCVNVGCVPTKTLVASARAAHVARRAGEFGVIVDGPIRVDMARVKARKDEIVRRSTTGVEGWMKGLANVTTYEGHGRFEGPNQVSVNGQTLESDKIFINVGGRAFAPPIPGLDEVNYLTNSSVMDVDFLPEHLIIVGGSYISLEFAQMYRRFGSAVTVIERGSALISREDGDVSEAILEILTKEGIDVRLGAGVDRVEKRGDDVVVHIRQGDVASEIGGSHLLVATGRRPNTDDLGLDRAGIEMDERGFISVDDQLQTNSCQKKRKHRHTEPFGSARE
jgi:pyruvate/2-oxoglutarate dehydrogenase complex dihydrolipoamide dehydrogenase (E3) component